MSEKEELLGEIAEAIATFKEAGEVTNEAISKASGKKTVAGRLILSRSALLLLSITTITLATSYHYSTHQGQVAENPVMKASRVLYESKGCDSGLITTYPDGTPVCELTPI